MLSTQSRQASKTRGKTLNESLRFSQFKRTVIKKLMNNGCSFSNYVDAESKVDVTFVTGNCFARKKKSFMPKLLGIHRE